MKKVKKQPKPKRKIYLIEVYHGGKVSEHAFSDYLSALLFYDKVNFTCQILGENGALFVTMPKEKLVNNENY